MNTMVNDKIIQEMNDRPEGFRRKIAEVLMFSTASFVFLALMYGTALLIRNG